MVVVVTLWIIYWLFENILPQAEVPLQLREHTQVQVLVEPCHARSPYPVSLGQARGCNGT